MKPKTAAAAYFTALALMIGAPFACMGVPALRAAYNSVAAPHLEKAPGPSGNECALGGAGMLLGDLLALGTALAASGRKREAQPG